MAIIMTARWKCRPGAEAKTEEALRTFVAEVAKNETRTKMYTALQQVDDTGSFITCFVFEDEAAGDFHSSTDWVKKFTGIIYPETLKPVEFTEYRLIASTNN